MRFLFSSHLQNCEKAVIFCFWSAIIEQTPDQQGKKKKKSDLYAGRISQTNFMTSLTWPWILILSV